LSASNVQLADSDVVIIPPTTYWSHSGLAGFCQKVEKTGIFHGKTGLAKIVFAGKSRFLPKYIFITIKYCYIAYIFLTSYFCFGQKTNCSVTGT